MPLAVRRLTGRERLATADRRSGISSAFVAGALERRISWALSWSIHLRSVVSRRRCLVQSRRNFVRRGLERGGPLNGQFNTPRLMRGRFPMVVYRRQAQMIADASITGEGTRYRNSGPT